MIYLVTIIGLRNYKTRTGYYIYYAKAAQTQITSTSIQVTYENDKTDKKLQNVYKMFTAAYFSTLSFLYALIQKITFKYPVIMENMQTNSRLILIN